MLAIPLIALLVAGLSAGAEASEPVRTCLSVARVIPFAPRGEVYVEVQASCTPEHFALEDPIVAYLEVLGTDSAPVGEDVRVYAERPNERSTFEFRELSFSSGDSILVRLSRFGEILGIQSVQVP